MDGSQDNTPVSRFPIESQLFGNEPNDAIRLLTECLSGARTPRLRFRIAALSSLRAIRLQDYSLCFCLRTLQAFALPVELFPRTEFAQHGYESYVTSVRPECIGIRPKREVDKRLTKRLFEGAPPKREK